MPKEMEKKAWRLIGMAKVSVNKTRRKLLMQEAFDLLGQASALRQLDPNGEELNGGVDIWEQGYRLRLSNGDGVSLWVFLQAESRADAAWTAKALAEAWSEHFDDYDLWDGVSHLRDPGPSLFFCDSAEEVAATSQQSLLEVEETILHSHAALAHSRRLLEATAALRDRLARHEN